MTAQARARLTGGNVLAMMLAFFATVIAVNGAFIYFALHSFPGEDVRRSYLQGLNYNETLADRRAQAALHWRAEARIADGGAHDLVEARFFDQDGRPLDGLSIEGVIRRPADAQDDHALAFAARGGGLYFAEAPPLADGVWDLRATARRGDVQFSFTRRQMWRRSR